jgi:hypothetical protein
VYTAGCGLIIRNSKFRNSSEFYFKNNSGLYGGGMYISQDLVLDEVSGLNNFTFIGNTARK